MRKLKRYLIALVVLGFVVTAPFYILPFFLSTTEVKGTVEQALESEIGQKVHIDGAIYFTPLPVPHFKIEGLRIDNSKEASTDYLLSVETLRVYPSLISLLTGDIHVRRVAFFSPTIELENFLDSKPNWILDGQTSVANPKDVKTPSIFDGITLSIHNGTVFFRSGYKAKPVERVVQMDDATLLIRSRQGPYIGYGTIRPKFSQIPLTFELETDKLDAEKGADFMLKLISGGSNISIDGNLQVLDQRPAVTGQLTASLDESIVALGKNFGLERFNLPNILEAVLSKDITTLTSDVILSTEGATLSNIAINSIHTAGDGDVSVVFGARNELDINLKLKSLDLDALSNRVKQAGDKAAMNPETAFKQPEVGTEIIAGSAARTSLTLPEDITLRLKLEFEKVVLRGVDNLALSVDAEFSEGRSLIKLLRATGLPGGSSIDWSGRVYSAAGEDADDKDALFRGKVTAKGEHLVPLLQWLQFEVPLDGVKGFQDYSIASDILWKEASVSLQSVVMVFDKTALKGQAVIDLKKEETVMNAAFNATHLDLDDYIADSDKASALSKSADQNLQLFDMIRSSDFLFDKIAVAFQVNELVFRDITTRDISGVFRARRAYLELDKLTFESNAYGKVQASVQIDSMELKPKINLDIALEKLDTEKIDQSFGLGSLFTTSEGTEIGWPSHSQKRPPKWSGEQINFSHLAIFDGKVKLSIQELVTPAFTMQAFDLDGDISNEQITIQKFQGRIFASRIEGKGAFGLSRPYVQGVFTIANSELSQIVSALFGYKNITGSASVSGSFSGSGFTVTQLLNSLSGTIQIIARGVTVEGFDLPRFANDLPRYSSIDEIRAFRDSVLYKGKTKLDYISGNVSLAGGRMRGDRIQISDAALMEGYLSFDVDLLNWVMSGNSSYTARLGGGGAPLTLRNDFSGAIYNVTSVWDKENNIEKYWEKRFYAR